MNAPNYCQPPAKGSEDLLTSEGFPSQLLFETLFGNSQGFDPTSMALLHDALSASVSQLNPLDSLGALQRNPLNDGGSFATASLHAPSSQISGNLAPATMLMPHNATVPAMGGDTLDVAFGQDLQTLSGQPLQHVLQPAAAASAADKRPVPPVTSLRRVGWRKYGQKRLQDDRVRSYYRCSIPGCSVKRQVVTSTVDENLQEVHMLGEHNHQDGSALKETIHEVRNGKRVNVGPDAQGQLNRSWKNKDFFERSSGRDPIAAPRERTDLAGGVRRNQIVATVSSEHPAVTVDLPFTERLMASVPAFVITDRSQTSHPILCASPGFSELTGYSGEEIMGKTLQLLQGSGTDSESGQALNDALLGRSPSQVVVLNYKKNSDAFWALINIAPMRRSDGTVLACVSHFMDVTKR